MRKAIIFTTLTSLLSSCRINDGPRSRQDRQSVSNTNAEHTNQVVGVPIVASPRDAPGSENVVQSASQSNYFWDVDRTNQYLLPLDQDSSVDQLILQESNNVPTGTNSTPLRVHVYIFDSGINQKLDMFKGRLSNGYSVFEANEVFDENDDNPNVDPNGHGSAIASVITRLTSTHATQVVLHSVRVLDETNGGNLNNISDAIAWVKSEINEHNEPSVVNMSITVDTPGHNAAVLVAESDVQSMIDAGIFVVVAAANNNDSACNYWPSRMLDVFSVGAISPLDTRWTSSNYGSCVDIFAPGEYIDVINGFRGNSGFPKYVPMSGTSIAAPMVTAVAANYLIDHPEVEPNDLAQFITDNAYEDVLIGDIGYNSPNLLLNSRLDTPVRPTNLSSGNFSVRVDTSEQSISDSEVEKNSETILWRDIDLTSQSRSTPLRISASLNAAKPGDAQLSVREYCNNNWMNERDIGPHLQFVAQSTNQGDEDSSAFTSSVGTWHQLAASFQPHIDAQSDTSYCDTSTTRHLRIMLKTTSPKIWVDDFDITTSAIMRQEEEGFGDPGFETNATKCTLTGLNMACNSPESCDSDPLFPLRIVSDRSVLATLVSNNHPLETVDNICLWKRNSLPLFTVE